MSSEALANTPDEELLFGRFRLNVRRRLLLDRGRRVRVGPRALSLLIVLAEGGGQVIPKRELQARVWSNLIVEEGTLRVHVAALRKALGVTEAGSRYIENVPGKGYRLVAPVTRQRAEPLVMGNVSLTANSARPASPSAAAALAGAESRIIGRVEAITRLATSLLERRLVTVTGPGGIGKTTVAGGVCEVLRNRYPQGIYLVDLAQIAASDAVPGALGDMLGVPAALSSVMEFLLDRSCLLVFDNCEHVRDGVAQLVRAVLETAPRVHILVTSRERLDLPQEWTYRLPPLQVPPTLGTPSGEKWLEYSAVKLFVSRAAAGTDVDFSDADLQWVAELCRRLDGNPLAIEIMAARLDLLGLEGLVSALDHRLHLSLGSHRTKELRHRSLREMLDRSYGLLSATDQRIFRHLAVFHGSFDARCAVEVVAEPADAAGAFASLLALTAKSLLVAETLNGKVRYQMLETPRLYALEKLREQGELEEVQHRHARMWCGTAAAENYPQMRRGADGPPLSSSCADDLRAAIHWCFYHHTLIPACSLERLFSLWFDFKFAAQSRDWQRRPPRAEPLRLPEPLPAILEELPREIEDSLRGALALAQQGSDSDVAEDYAHWGLWLDRLLKRQYRLSVRIASVSPERPAEVCGEAVVWLEPLLILAHFYAGELDQARSHAQAALTRDGTCNVHDRRRQARRAHLRAYLARILFLQGNTPAALEQASLSVREAQASQCQQVTGFCRSLLTALTIFAGDLREGRVLLDLLRQDAMREGAENLQLWVLCLEAALAQEMESRSAATPPAGTAGPTRNAWDSDCMGLLRHGLLSPASLVWTEPGLATG